MSTTDGAQTQSTPPAPQSECTPDARIAAPRKAEPSLDKVNYFYHLKEVKISEFWLLADFDFDYRADK